MQREICKTCKYNKGFTYPPTLGRKTDGVICGNIEALRKICQDPNIKKPQEVWRIEVIDNTLECPYWESK
jgi:hypothetical protein